MNKWIICIAIMLIAAPAEAGWWQDTKDWLSSTFTINPMDSVAASGDVDLYSWLRK